VLNFNARCRCPHPGEGRSKPHAYKRSGGRKAGNILLSVDVFYADEVCPIKREIGRYNQGKFDVALLSSL